MKDEFVMVPRDWAEGVISAGSGEPVCQSDVELLSAAVKAEQNHGEPVAWALIGATGGTEIGLDRSELLHDQGKYGGDLVPLYTRPAQVEPVVKLTLSELLADLPDGYSKDDVAFGWHECVDNYTHADPAEVEWLRAGLKRQQGVINTFECEVADLRAQVAEALAIIERVRVKELVSPCCPLGKRIDAALSASAEPSAPVDPVCNCATRLDTNHAISCPRAALEHKP